MISTSQKINAYCNRMGLRKPSKKILVAEYLQRLNCFVTATNLYLKMRNGAVKVSYATIYQSLNWLIDHGFAECETNQDKAGSARYRLRKDSFRKL